MQKMLYNTPVIKQQTKGNRMKRIATFNFQNYSATPTAPAGKQTVNDKEDMIASENKNIAMYKDLIKQNPEKREFYETRIAEAEDRKARLRLDIKVISRNPFSSLCDMTERTHKR